MSYSCSCNTPSWSHFLYTICLLLGPISPTLCLCVRAPRTPQDPPETGELIKFSLISPKLSPLGGFHHSASSIHTLMPLKYVIPDHLAYNKHSLCYKLHRDSIRKLPQWLALQVKQLIRPQTLCPQGGHLSGLGPLSQDFALYHNINRCLPCLLMVE